MKESIQPDEDPVSGVPESPFDPTSAFASWLQQACDELGRVTIALVGKTGAGKSTLVNAVFGTHLAQTGVGRPVTARLGEHRGEHVTLLDSRGLELEEDLAAVAADLEELQRVRTRDGVAEVVHAVWFCVNAETARVEEAESEVVRRLAKVAPVVVVLTRVLDPNDPEHVAFRRACVAAFPEAESIVDVLASSRVIGAETISAHGVPELVGATVPVLPEGARRAFVVMQRHVLGVKLVEARSVAARRAAQISSMPAISGRMEPHTVARHHVRMLAEISAVFELGISQVGLQALAQVTLRSMRGADGLVGTVAEWLGSAGVPMAEMLGDLAGREVARRTTLALGSAYAEVCHDVAAREGTVVDETALLEALRRRVLEAMRGGGEAGGDRRGL